MVLVYILFFHFSCNNLPKICTILSFFAFFSGFSRKTMVKYPHEPLVPEGASIQKHHPSPCKKDNTMNILEYENYHEQISHGELDFPYNTYLCSIPLDFSQVPLHWHEEMEIIYIKKGQGIVTVDFTSQVVTGPSLVLILPGPWSTRTLFSTPTC